ncbi:unnamed protein product, partial [Darwinula stevensoni]
MGSLAGDKRRVVRKPMLDGRIVGGEDAEEGEIPWQVSLETFGSHVCGGFILDEMNVITAAHCCDAVSSFTVVAGEYDRFQTSGNEVEVDVARMIPHEDYNGFDLTADICLLHLESPLPFNGFIGPVAMPKQGEDWIGELMSVSGWGSTSEGGSLSNILQKGDFVVVADEECDDYYASFGGIDFDSHICAGNMPEGGIDSCQGDSGGPMFETSGRRITIGITSWGVGCARPEFPGVYTQLATYTDWVEANRQRF